MRLRALALKGLKKHFKDLRLRWGRQYEGQKKYEGGLKELNIFPFLDKDSLIYPPHSAVIYYVYKTIKKIKVALVARPDRLRWSRRSDLGRDSVPEQAVPIFGSKGRCRGWLNLDRLLKNNSAIGIGWGGCRRNLIGSGSHGACWPCCSWRPTHCCCCSFGSRSMSGGRKNWWIGGGGPRPHTCEFFCLDWGLSRSWKIGGKCKISDFVSHFDKKIWPCRTQKCQQGARAI